MWWRIALLSIAYLVLGAHFLRFGNTIVAVLVALAPLLLLLRQAWIVILLQVGLLAGVLFVWAPTTYHLVNVRQLFGLPWEKTAIILSLVMAFSVAVSWSAGALKKCCNRSLLND